MEVDDLYNPSEEKNEHQCKLEYLQRQRNQEAEKLRQKYLGPKAPVISSCNHHESRKSVKAKSKPTRPEKVAYVFCEKESSKKQNEDGQGESYSEILQQKEHIRCLITPNAQDQNDNDSKPDQIQNEDGRSPYQGAQLKVVSVNHKNAGNDPVFVIHNQDDKAPGLDSVKECVAEGDNKPSDGNEAVENTPGPAEWQSNQASIPLNFDQQLKNAKEERAQNG